MDVQRRDFLVTGTLAAAAVAAATPALAQATQVAAAGPGEARGGSVLPGIYTIRITSNGKTYDTSLAVGLDPRVKWTPADRKAQFDAAMKTHALFNDESALFARIIGLRQKIAEASKGRAQSRPRPATAAASGTLA